MSRERHTGTLQITASGPWFIGGHSPPPGGLDAATARRGDTPILPASALKGALREAVYRRLHAEGERCCAPWTPWSERQADCAQNPCFICRVFGAPGPDRPGVVEQGDGPEGGGWAPGLRLSDAAPAAQTPLGERFGVGIDRVTGRAAEARLFQRQIADPGQPTTLHAPFRALLSQADMDYLAESARLVDRVGNSRTRGLGEARFELIVESTADKPCLTVSNVDGARALVRVTAVEPLHIGAPPRPDSARATLAYVPGSALHGALFAAAHRVNQADGKHLATALSASDLLPAADDALPVPYHRALLRCRDCDTIVDRSLDEAIALARLRGPGRALPEAPACPACAGADLKPAEGLLAGSDARRRLVTRLSIDPRTQSAAPGMLYAREQIEPGTCFVGSVELQHARSLDIVRRLGASGEPVLLGGLRTRGLGAVNVDFLPWPDSDLEARIHALQAMAAKHPLLPELGWDPTRLLLVVARTPLAADAQGGDCVGSSLFGAGNYTLRGSWQRLEPRSGWDDKLGCVRPVREVYRAGSAWLIEAHAALAPRMDRLLDAEGAGVGADRHLGLGRLYFCPPVPQNSRRSP